MFIGISLCKELLVRCTSDEAKKPMTAAVGAASPGRTTAGRAGDGRRLTAYIAAAGVLRRDKIVERTKQGAWIHLRGSGRTARRQRRRSKLARVSEGGKRDRLPRERHSFPNLR